jgi:hypothetical protein
MTGWRGSSRRSDLPTGRRTLGGRARADAGQADVNAKDGLAGPSVSVTFSSSGGWFLQPQPLKWIPYQ